MNRLRVRPLTAGIIALAGIAILGWVRQPLPQASKPAARAIFRAPEVLNTPESLAQELTQAPAVANRLTELPGDPVVSARPAIQLPVARRVQPQGERTRSQEVVHQQRRPESQQPVRASASASGSAAASGSTPSPVRTEAPAVAQQRPAEVQREPMGRTEPQVRQQEPIQADVREPQHREYEQRRDDRERETAASAARPSYDPAPPVLQQNDRSWKRRAAIIGGAAAAGAAIGGLSGGGKGAVIGAVTGAAGGYVYDRMNGRRNGRRVPAPPQDTASAGLNPSWNDEDLARPMYNVRRPALARQYGSRGW